MVAANITAIEVCGGGISIVAIRLGQYLVVGSQTIVGIGVEFALRVSGSLVRKGGCQVVGVLVGCSLFAVF